MPPTASTSGADDAAATGHGVLLVLRAKRATLRSGERKVASASTERPHEIRQLSILDLAERSGVSEATVMRLRQAPGCRDYSDFRVFQSEDLAVSRAAGTRLAGETHAPSPCAAAHRRCPTASPRPGSKETLTNHHAAITVLDEQLGRIMAHLESRHLAGDTIFSFTPDHGGMLWSHGMMKKQQPWEESIGIPLTARWWGASPRAGRATRS